MEGNPANLVDYKDGNVEQDHSYYGNGCEAHEYSPCSTRFAETADGETQKNGTLLNFQAATSGSGGTTTTPNANAPDTFCPLGWQLPYSGTGGDYYDKSRSWMYLLTVYSIGFDPGTSADATKVKSYPFSNIPSGSFHWASGELYALGTNFYYWSPTVVLDNRGYTQTVRPGNIVITETSDKQFGSPIRCVDYLSLHRRHGGGNKY